METFERTIAGYTWTLPIRYFEGHICSAPEARALNQTLGENIGNQFRKKVEAKEKELALEELPEDELKVFSDILWQAAMDYDFASRGTGTSRVMDPLERMARKIAKAEIVETLRTRNTTLKAFLANIATNFVKDGASEEEAANAADDKWEDILTRASSQSGVLSEAKRRLKASQKVAVEGLDDLLAA